MEVTPRRLWGATPIASATAHVQLLEAGLECLLTSRHHLAGEAIHIQVSFSDRTVENQCF